MILVERLEFQLFRLCLHVYELHFSVRIQTQKTSRHSFRSITWLKRYARSAFGGFRVCIPRNVRFQINRSKSDTQVTSLDRQRQPIVRLAIQIPKSRVLAEVAEKNENKRNFRPANRKGEHVFMLYKSDSRRGHKYWTSVRLESWQVGAVSERQRSDVAALIGNRFSIALYALPSCKTSWPGEKYETSTKIQ